MVMNLIESYQKVISRCIDEKGVFPHQMITIDGEGKTKMYALMLNDPAEVYSAVIKALKEKPAELIYSLDRFHKPGQDIELGDFLAGAYWDGKWKPFVIEYQNEPRIMKPIDWGNVFWNEAIFKELKHHEIS